MKAKPFHETALLKRVAQLPAWPEGMLSLDCCKSAAVHLRGVLLVAQHPCTQEARAENVHLVAD